MDDLKLFRRSEDKIDSLVQTVQLFCENTRMEFRLKTCGAVVNEKRKEGEI